VTLEREQPGEPWKLRCVYSTFEHGPKRCFEWGRCTQCQRVLWETKRVGGLHHHPDNEEGKSDESTEPGAGRAA
jgi:hypothetical protein